jgi:hypothetical protein
MHRCGNYRNTVGNVDASDSRCRCIYKIIARDLRLVASRLYRMGVTRPGSRAAITRSVNPETVILVENGGYGEAAFIGLETSRLCQLEMVENWCIGESPFQLPKCKFSIPSPFPFDLFRHPGVICFL